MLVPAVILIVTGLLVVVSIAEPIVTRLKVPIAVAYAFIGIGIGLVSHLMRQYYDFPADGVGSLLTDPPFDSSIFIFVLMPILIFQAAINIDVREIAEDAVPVVMLSVIAVVVATLFVGGFMHWVSGFSLMACLLLGAVISTTDPVAVIGILRDVGAPARLGRLLEGESLFNDAAAITLFALFLGYVLQPQPVDVAGAVMQFVVLGGGGAIFGYLAGRAICLALAFVGDRPMSQVSLCLAAPYLAFVAAELWVNVSGVVAVVIVGITLNLYGPGYATPVGWNQFKAMSNQLDYWASALIFVLASILVPRLLAGATWSDLFLILMLVVASFIARGMILFGVQPILQRFGLSPPIDPRYSLVIFWGGLRGALTLALALALTENQQIPAEVQRFIAVLATGYVLFTILVQGTTLHYVMRLTGLDKLSPLDAALRQQVLGVAQTNVRETLTKAASLYELQDLEIEERLETSSELEEKHDVAEFGRESRMTLGLVTLARREREIILEQFRERTISFSIVSDMLAESARLIDSARTGGEKGYAAVAAQNLELPQRLRIAHGLHRRLGVDSYFSRLLSDRFEILLASRIVLMRLEPFIKETIRPVLGLDVASRAAELLQDRRQALQRAVDSLGLQFPEYAQELKRSFVVRTALRHEELEYENLYEQSIIGPELHRDLKMRVASRRDQADKRPPLDLGLDIHELIRRFPLFAALNEQQVTEMADLMKPVFTLPGEVLIHQGDEGDAAYFISSGAVEVRAGDREIRLGTGDVFGELALLTSGPRTADVISIAYCSLLRLEARDFNTFIAANPDVAAHIEAVASKRMRENAGAQAARKPAKK